MEIQATMTNLSRTGALGCLLLLAAGCSAASEREEVDQIMQELGEAACFTIAPDADWSQFSLYFSPRTYTRAGCYKGHIIDFHHPGVVEGGGWLAQTWWADNALTTQAACESAWMGGYIAQWDGSAYVPFDMVSTHGIWHDGQCVGDGWSNHEPYGGWQDHDWATFGLDPDLDACGDYRLVLSVRTAQTAGAATRKLGFDFRTNGIPEGAPQCQ